MFSRCSTRREWGEQMLQSSFLCEHTVQRWLMRGIIPGIFLLERHDAIKWWVDERIAAAQISEEAKDTNTPHCLKLHLYIDISRLCVMRSQRKKHSASLNLACTQNNGIRQWDCWSRQEFKLAWYCRLLNEFGWEILIVKLFFSTPGTLTAKITKDISYF